MVRKGSGAAMSQNKITVDDLIIQPNIEREIVDIYPSIGVVGDEAYVGVWIPSQVEDQKGSKTHKDLL